jgi:Tol biopolymer transport system component
MPIIAARAIRVALILPLVVPAFCATRAHAGPTGAQPMHWTPGRLSSDQYESSPTFSRDGSELYFFRANRQFGGYRLLQSACRDGQWSAPAEPAFAAPLPALESDPALDESGRRLYFVSNRGAEDPDDLDIWVVERGKDHAWGAPRRLPEPVNSPASELLPRPLSDGRLLFGSSRAGGHGQGDIYIATSRQGGGWSVANIGPPVSTAANEYEAEMSRDGRVLVVVADRGDRSHLYVYDKRGDNWQERGRIAARDDVFQVGPSLSPDGGRLVFAQADGDRSGELFLVDLVPGAATDWPPACR